MIRYYVDAGLENIFLGNFHIIEVSETKSKINELTIQADHKSD